MNNKTEETREERIKRHIVNSAKERLLGAEVCVPVFKLKSGASYYYPLQGDSIEDILQAAATVWGLELERTKIEVLGIPWWEK